MPRISTLLAFSILLTLAAAAAAEESSGSFTFKWSGYIKADFAYDETRVVPGNYALYVSAPEPTYIAKNSATNITSRETRLGFDFGWLEENYKTSAKIEFDFYGLGVASTSPNSQENKATTMLRHAYLEISRGHWAILAGQTSDLMSPLVPKTVNYSVCWDQGNLGYRRPQFRLSTWADISERVKTTFAVAAARTLGADLDKDGIDDGADCEIPTIQGRIGLATRNCERGSLEVGISGHYGKERYSEDTETTESWSACLDLKTSFCRKLELAGEFFIGENLGTYLGAVGQTVNPLGDEIRALGGWAQVSFVPVDRVTINAGYAVDDPDEKDLVIAEGSSQKNFIDKNDVYFGSLYYNITSATQAMLEISRLSTSYLYRIYAEGKMMSDSKSFDDLRVQFAMKVSFK